MEIKLKLTESFNTWIQRDSITINSEDYTELNGMTEDEVHDYIKHNSYDMDAPPEDGKYTPDSLHDLLLEQSFVREKYTNEESDISFD